MDAQLNPLQSPAKVNFEILMIWVSFIFQTSALLFSPNGLHSFTLLLGWFDPEIFMFLTLEEGKGATFTVTPSHSLKVETDQSEASILPVRHWEIFNPAHTQPLDTLEKRCISSYLQRWLCCYGDQDKEVARRLVIGNSLGCIQDAVWAEIHRNLIVKRQKKKKKIHPSLK